MTDEKKKSRRGFAAMDPDARARISSMGGKAAQAKGTGHAWTSDEAREAGRKGGRATAKKRAGAIEVPIRQLSTAEKMGANGPGNVDVAIGTFTGEAKL